MAASYLADYRMGTGERRELVLTDGTLLWLDSASAVDVAVDARGRHITVHAGEILIDTEHAAQGLPPLRVTTLHGTVRPLGTRFTVNRQDTQTRVAVLRHAVELLPLDGRPPLVLNAGEQGVLEGAGARHDGAVTGEPDAWTRGLLILRRGGRVAAGVGRVPDRRHRPRAGRRGTRAARPGVAFHPRLPPGRRPRLGYFDLGLSFFRARAP
ncbi:hypothetical protein G6F22_017864 [Rhizopus arrhizus]|nr:hypothetical protein G6F22_017864 [Rhizopus arrhizus]